MKDVHILEFGCEAPLRFYERCSACPKFPQHCPDLELGLEILRGRKKVVFEKDALAEGIHAGSFKCLAPLRYFGKTRFACPHQGRCREEGLLMALLSGKRKLDSRHLAPVSLPPRIAAPGAGEKRETGAV